MKYLVGKDFKKTYQPALAAAQSAHLQDSEKLPLFASLVNCYHESVYIYFGLYCCKRSYRPE